jgi:hypothetical protein
MLFVYQEIWLTPMKPFAAPADRKPMQIWSSIDQNWTNAAKNLTRWTYKPSTDIGSDPGVFLRCKDRRPGILANMRTLLPAPFSYCKAHVLLTLQRLSYKQCRQLLPNTLACLLYVTHQETPSISPRKNKLQLARRSTYASFLSVHLLPMLPHHYLPLPHIFQGITHTPIHE